MFDPESLDSSRYVKHLPKMSSFQPNCWHGLWKLLDAIPRHLKQVIDGQVPKEIGRVCHLVDTAMELAAGNLRIRSGNTALLARQVFMYCGEDFQQILYLLTEVSKHSGFNFALVHPIWELACVICVLPPSTTTGVCLLCRLWPSTLRLQAKHS